MDKYKNKYRIKSTRLQQWDYRWTGAYFITICTKNRMHYFGNIVETNNIEQPQKMKLSPVGVIADILWYEIPNHAKNVELGAFVVMPNHVHGIIIINQNGADETGMPDALSNATNVSNVETGHALSLQMQPSQPSQPSPVGKNRFQNIGKNSISSIVGSYKSAVTKHARRLGYNFAWQSRFYDHIIRDEKSFLKISDYIQNNPINWENDELYLEE